MISLKRFFLIATLGVLLPAGPAVAADPPPAVRDGLKAILAVSREGVGNEAAAAGWKAVVAAGPDALIPTLTAFDTASPAAANWLRAAADAIAEREQQAGRKLPADRLLAFVKDTQRRPAARRIAFELYTAADPAAAKALLPTLIDDPSTEIRRDAIAARLAAAGDKPPADELRTLFAATRDKDQAEQVAKLLGPGQADFARHFNIVTEWHVAGPFDSPGGTGFAKGYPPEAGVVLDARYEGKGGAAVAWKYAQAHDPFGRIDLNEFLGKHKDAVAYAHAIVEVDRETPAEVRVSSPNAVAVFLNGKKLFELEEYHHGAPFDQYVAKGTLAAGRNEVLIKVLQNDQKESWAQAWNFSARICDATGGPVPVTQYVVKDGKSTAVKPGARKPAPKKDPEEKK